MIPLLFLLLGLLVGGCHEGERNRFFPSTSLPPAVEVRMMVLNPGFVVLPRAGASVRLSSFLWLSDGTAFKDPDGIVWESENERVATVDTEGTVSAVSSGETLIKGRFLNWEGRSKIIVQTSFRESMSPGIDHSESPPVVEPPSETELIDEEETAPLAENPPEEPSLSQEPPPSDKAPYADKVVSYSIGPGGGLNKEDLPGIVLGPPRGWGPFQGSFDVFSLGRGGEIVLEFTDYILFDGPGVDLTVFENPFQIGGNPDNTFAEPGIVAVSEDGEDFFEFPCDFETRPYVGCAGVHPTLANPDVNDIDPTDPTVSGGDSFDLADVGLKTARFVRIRDSNSPYGPVGLTTAGFDLDAVAIVNGTVPSSITFIER